MKRKKYWAALLVLASILLVAGTSAVFLSLSEKKNEITVGSNEIEIVEDFKLPDHIKYGEETTFQKKSRSRTMERQKFLLEQASGILIIL